MVVAATVLGACGGRSNKSSGSAASADHPNRDYINVSCQTMVLAGMQPMTSTDIAALIETTHKSGVKDLEKIGDEIAAAPTEAAQLAIADKVDEWCKAHPSAHD